MTRSSLERDLGSAALVFSSPQMALECALEALGVPQHRSPVLLSSITPDYVCSAVLRTGGRPAILDINPSSFMFEEEVLAEAVKEHPEALVCLYCPFGMKVPPSIIKALEETVVILIQDILPDETVRDQFPLSAFVIRSLQPYSTGNAAVLFNPFEDQIKVLRQVRDGALGRHDSVSDADCRIIQEHLARTQDHLDSCEKAFKEYDAGIKQCLSVTPLVHLEGVLQPRYYPVKVRNAAHAVTYLATFSIHAKVGVEALYKVSEIASRYKEAVEYPVTESILDTILLLPLDIPIDRELFDAIGFACK